jgi:hypothetical protein
MNHVIGPPDMGQDGQSFGFVIEQDRVVRSDLLAVIAAHQDPPRVLADQPTDNLGILRGVERVGAH